MPPAAPLRLVRAVELLAPRPDDRVLEIGCGAGVAAELLLRRLDGGRLTAIDRSAAAVRAAERRNAEAVAAGRARFLPVAFETAALDGERFDRALAVDVNRFWLRPADESARWAGLLAPGGELLLVCQPPSGQPPGRVADGFAAYLRASGFAEVEAGGPGAGPAPLVAARGRWG